MLNNLTILDVIILVTIEIFLLLILFIRIRGFKNTPPSLFTDPKPEQRHVIFWRKTLPDHILDWDYRTIEPYEDIKTYVRNLKDQGVHQYAVYKLGEKLEEHSSKY